MLPLTGFAEDISIGEASDLQGRPHGLFALGLGLLVRDRPGCGCGTSMVFAFLWDVPPSLRFARDG